MTQSIRKKYRPYIEADDVTFLSHLRRGGGRRVCPDELLRDRQLSEKETTTMGEVPKRVLGNVVQIGEQRIEAHLGEMMRSTVEKMVGMVVRTSSRALARQSG